MGVLLRDLMALSPGTDRATLVRTVDSAVAGVLQRLGGHPPGTPLDSDTIQLTRATLGFLEACAALKDPEFARQSRTWAGSLQTAFTRALAPPAPPAAGKPAGAEKADKPDKGAKAKPAPAKPAEKADASPAAADAFAAAFEEQFCRYIRRKVEAFEIMGQSHERLPFVVAPAFSLIFEQIIKSHIIPRMLVNRRIKTLSTTMKEGQYDALAFKQVFEAAARDNMVRAIWNDVWNEIQAALAANDQANQAKGKNKKKKTSFWDRLALWRHKDDRKKSFAYDADLAELVAKAFEAGGVDGNFDPPKPRDIPLFLVLFDFDLDAIDAAKTSVRQLIEQEAKGQAREGATRDFLNQLFKNLPEHCGEMFALWTYYQYREHFSYKILRSFQASYGKNLAERRKVLPLFMRWVPDFTRIKQEI